MSQTNIKVGRIPLLCAEDLTGKETLLMELTSTGCQRPNAITDLTPYLCVTGAAQGESGDFDPFTPESNRRVIAKGAGSKGDQLVLADTGTAADRGKVRALPAAAGTYRVIAIAEEDFVDGQHVLCRPWPVGNVTVN